MFQKIKQLLYFPLAGYFRFFASIRLKKWNPSVVVITGSSGKTTLLHLVESQLGNEARYSHHANSAIGIPFDILDIHRKDLTLAEWFTIPFLPWINIFKKLPDEKIYIVEADCDRPHEGDFLSSLLKPEVTLWTNVARTHTINFENLVKNGKFGSVEEAIAYEFGFFAERTKKLVVIDSGSKLQNDQMKRVQAEVKKVSIAKLEKYIVSSGLTEFRFSDQSYKLKYLLPKKIGTSILMCKELLKYLKFDFDKDFPNLHLPSGRNSVFEGIKNTTIVDSSYNANLDSMKAVIEMFGEIKSGKKWVVLGDMLEQGIAEKEEHEKLADYISAFGFDRIILMGPRVTKYTYPILRKKLNSNIVIEHFLGPKETLDYLSKNIKGGETILFKGARFLEGVIENLLENKADAKYLARREKVWEIRRKKWGL